MSQFFNHEYCRQKELYRSQDADTMEEDEFDYIDSEYCTQSAKAGDELLIDLVRSRPFLYDKSMRDYRDQNMKENAWKEISVVMNMSASDCQTRWVRIRQRFSKEKQQRALDTRSGAGKSTKQQWVLFNHLNFLEKFVVQRKSISNVNANMFVKQTRQDSYQGDFNFEPIPPLVVQIPSVSPLQESSPSPLQRSPLLMQRSTPSMLEQSESPMQRSTPLFQQSGAPRPTSAPPPISCLTPSPLQQLNFPSTRSSTSSNISSCYSGGNRSNKKVKTDPVEVAFLQMNSTLSTLASTISQNKKTDTDVSDADTLFGKLVTAELKKVIEPKKTILKTKLMQILYSMNDEDELFQ